MTSFLRDPSALALCAFPGCGHSKLDHDYWMLALEHKRGCDLCEVSIAEHEFVAL